MKTNAGNSNPISRLNEFCQKNHLPIARYRTKMHKSGQKLPRLNEVEVSCHIANIFEIAYGATKKEAKQKAAERVMKVLLKTPIDKIRVKNELPIDVVRIKSGLPIDEARVKNELPIDEVQVKQKLPIDENRKGSEPQIDIKTVENQILQKRAELDKLLELHWKLLQPTIEKLEAEEVFDVEDHPM